MRSDTYVFFIIAMGNCDCDDLKIVRQVISGAFKRPEIYYASLDSSNNGENSSEKKDLSSGVLKSANIPG
jgi:hypothetical protein